jgi:hypothetical protein
MAVKENEIKSQLESTNKLINLFGDILSILTDKKLYLEKELKNIGKNCSQVPIDFDSLSIVKLMQLLTMVEDDESIAKIQSLIHSVRS